MRLPRPRVLPGPWAVEPEKISSPDEFRIVTVSPGYESHMERHMPAGLSDTQRNVLSEFFAGRIPAGQLTERLGIESAPIAQQAADPEASRQRAMPNPLHGLLSRHSIAPPAPPHPGRAENRA